MDVIPSAFGLEPLSRQELSQGGSGRESGSNENGAPSSGGGGSNTLDGLLPPDLPVSAAEDLPQLPSSFMDPSTFGQPVELEDIQLQNFVPEHQQQAEGRKNESEAAPGSDPRPPPPPPPLPPPNGLTSSSESRPSTSSGFSQQHSSILESMTGPLSKRLRTLHNIQQKQTTTSASSTQSSSSPPPSSSSSQHQQQHQQQQQQHQQHQHQQQATLQIKVIKEDAAAKSGNNGSNNNEASSSGIPPPPLGNPLSDSDSNHSNGGGGGGGDVSFSGNNSNGPTTHHTYSVTLEHQMLSPSVIMKPKRLFEQKMWELGGATGQTAGQDDSHAKSTHPALPEKQQQQQQQQQQQHQNGEPPRQVWRRLRQTTPHREGARAEGLPLLLPPPPR